MDFFNEFRCILCVHLLAELATLQSPSATLTRREMDINKLYIDSQKKIHSRKYENLFQLVYSLVSFSMFLLHKIQIYIFFFGKKIKQINNTSAAQSKTFSIILSVT